MDNGSWEDRILLDTMADLALIIAVIALLAAIAPWLRLLALRNEWTLEGKLILVNNCNEDPKALPDEVDVTARCGVPFGVPTVGVVRVALVATAGGRARTGFYRITVSLRPPLGGMLRWSYPQVTRVTGEDVCQPIPCPEGPFGCLNLSDIGGVPEVPAVGRVTTRLVVVACGCPTLDDFR